MKLFSIKKKPVVKASKEAKVKNSLLHTYLTSLLSLVLCVAMFLGTSFAWFTSEVENKGNEIYIGTLDVELEKQVDNADGTTSFVSLSAPVDGVEYKLFDGGIRWEPGYTALETIKITNKGDLAFRYELNFTDGKLTFNDADDTELGLDEVAENFDVWVYQHENNTAPTVEYYAAITAENSGWENAGTLAEVIAGKAVLRGNMTNTDVAADPETAHTYTIALHMKEDADSSVMGRKISLNVKLVAYQMNSESDAFGITYDLGAFANTLAEVNNWQTKDIKLIWGISGSGAENMTLDTAYQFLPKETLEEAQAAPYRYYIADFVVKADKDVQGNSMALAGYYKAWCQYKDDNWVALTTSDTIAANTEIRLVQSMGGGSISVNYEDLCNYGNDGIGFLCGAVDISDEKVNAGTTLTVELRLYETYSEEECLEKFGEKSTNRETGRYITVGSYTYKFE